MVKLNHVNLFIGVVVMTGCKFRFSIIFDIINWIISILFVLLGLIFLFVFFDSKSLGDMLYGLFFIALGLILCPLITKHIKKYKFYRICKWLIIILFAIYLFFV